MSEQMMGTIRTAEDLEDALVRMLNWQDSDAFEAIEEGVRDVGSFADRGVLTRDKGLVLTFRNGAEFQVTIVRSGRPDEPSHECPECGEEQVELQAFLDHMVDDHDWDEYDAIDAANAAMGGPLR